MRYAKGSPEREPLEAAHIECGQKCGQIDLDLLAAIDARDREIERLRETVLRQTRVLSIAAEAMSRAGWEQGPTLDEAKQWADDEVWNAKQAHDWLAAALKGETK